MDLGAQAAPLRLLIKDHKQYDPSSGNALPSRPVVNGRSGYNNHLSEFISMILGPVSKEAPGNEINSTGDLLSGVDMVNSRLSQVADQSGSPVNEEEDDLWCDHCSNCNQPPVHKKELEDAKRLIEKTCKKKPTTAMNVSNSLKSKLKASRAATKLYQRCCIQASNPDPAHFHCPAADEPAHCSTVRASEIPTNQEAAFIRGESATVVSNLEESHLSIRSLSNEIELSNVTNNSNMEDSLIIAGFDVQSMYPSLRDVDTACIAREMIIHSNVDLRAWI